jgi:hypothetical protein
MSGCEKSMRPITVPIWTWAALIPDLRRRGKGRGESGAFLLGRQGASASHVTTYICYDVLDPNAYQHGAIVFHAAGYAALWRFCKERKLEVLADLHTHPGRWVGQSSIDQRNPMIPTIGHTAIIVPNYANTGRWSLDGVGVYEYLGRFQWKTHQASGQQRRIRLSLW